MKQLFAAITAFLIAWSILPPPEPSKTKTEAAASVSYGSLLVSPDEPVPTPAPTPDAGGRGNPSPTDLSPVPQPKQPARSVVKPQDAQEPPPQTGIDFSNPGLTFQQESIYPSYARLDVHPAGFFPLGIRAAANTASSCPDGKCILKKKTVQVTTSPAITPPTIVPDPAPTVAEAATDATVYSAVTVQACRPRLFGRIFRLRR